MAGYGKWIGTVPVKDDFGSVIVDSFIDGATTKGAWAIMTPENHAKVGRGLGTGKGQRYENRDGAWIKVEG